MREPNVSEAEAIEAVASATGLRAAAAVLVPTIEDNLVFAIDDRWFAKFGPRDRTRKEALAYRAARDAGVPVPEIAGVGDVFFVVEKAPGVPASALPEPQRRRALRELGEALRALHTVRARGWGGPDMQRLAETGEWVAPDTAFRPARAEDWGLRYVEERRLLNTDEIALIRAWIADVGDIASDDSCLLHRDVTSQCAFADVETGALRAVIDFGDAMCGLPAWEFTTLAVREPVALPVVAEGYGFDLDAHREHISIMALVRLIDGVRRLHAAARDEWRDRIAAIRALGLAREG